VTESVKNTNPYVPPSSSLPTIICSLTPHTKPKHLPKSTSLPSLQLTPTCLQCGSTNTYNINITPLCLWCAWTVGEFDFEQKRGSGGSGGGVRRRASSPGRVGFQIGLGFGGCHAHAGLRHSPTEDAESSRLHSSYLLSDGNSKEKMLYGMITSTRSELVCGWFVFWGWVCGYLLTCSVFHSVCRPCLIDVPMHRCRESVLEASSSRPRQHKNQNQNQLTLRT